MKNNKIKSGNYKISEEMFTFAQNLYNSIIYASVVFKSCKVFANPLK